MKHLTEEELFAYREGEPTQREAIAEHLTSCTACRTELDRIEAVLSALDNLPVPERGPEYGRAVWQKIAPQLAGKSGARMARVARTAPLGSHRSNGGHGDCGIRRRALDKEA